MKCLICGRDPVPIKKGRVASHLSPGGVKCIAQGIPTAQLESHRKLTEEGRKSKER